MNAYAELGVRRVVNASGIYTDLGGSVLSPSVWAAAAEANTTWASLPELLDAAGARVAALCGAEAARIVPGASAGLALAVAACVCEGDGARMESLPATDATVLLQRGHAYKYARCARLAGVRVEVVDDLASALRAEPAAAAVLHPGHLDGAPGTLGIDCVAPLARTAGVPVVVDAAYLSFPLEALRTWATAGDLACFSAKYVWGPNGGGWVTGRRERVAALAALDFTGYESGRWETFGRPFKLDRATVVATYAALAEWVAADHEARLHTYAELAEALACRLSALRGAHVSVAQFTLDERLAGGPHNAVVVEGAGALAAPLAARDPSVRAIALGDALVFCTEALRGPELHEVTLALEAVWPG